MNQRMTPIDMRDGKPVDQRLYDAANAYCLKEFGQELNLAYYARAWLSEALVNGEWIPVGIAGVRNMLDIPTFHVTPVGQDREAFKAAEETTSMMYMRLNNYLADLGNRDGSTLIYVAPEVERLWRRFLKRVGGRPANRYEVPVR